MARVLCTITQEDKLNIERIGERLNSLNDLTLVAKKRKELSDDAEFMNKLNSDISAAKQDFSRNWDTIFRTYNIEEYRDKRIYLDYASNNVCLSE